MTRLITTWVFVTAFLFANIATAGLPPTSTKSQLDTSKSTTFDFQAPFNQFTKPNGTTALIETGNKNLLKDPGFESSDPTAVWVIALAGTVSRTSTAADVGSGSYALSYDAAATNGTVTSAAVAVPNGFIGKTLEASCDIKNTSAGLYKIQAYDGTNVLAEQLITTDSTYFIRNTLRFPSPTSGSISIRFLAGTAGEPVFYVDDCYLGIDRGQGSTQLISEPTAYTPTIGLTGGTTSASAKWQRVGTDIEVWGDATFTTVFTGGTATVSLPSVCTIDASKFPTTPATGVGIIDSKVYFYDVGSGQYGGTVTYNDTSTVLLRTLQDDVGAGGNHVFADAAINTTIPFTWANNDRLSFRFKVPCVGWTAQTIVMPDAQGWYVDATIAGANASLGTSSVSSYTVIGSSSLSMTKASGSADVQVPCSGGNAPSGLTCSAGSELFGAAFNIPKSGAYRVCVSANHYIDSPAGSIHVTATFQLAETSTTSDTILQEGKGKAMSGSVAISGDRREYRSVYTCGDFVFSSVGQKVVKLMYETEISGTPDNHYIKADGDTLLGQPDVHLTVWPLSQQQQAILANSVSTSAQNGLKTESFSFTCSGSSSIGVQLGGTSWVSSVGNIAAGVCAVGISAGTFSGSPQCQATWTGGGSNAIVYTYAETSSGFNVGAVTDTGGAASSFTGKAMCVGPR